MAIKKGVQSQEQIENMELLNKCSSYPLKQSQKDFIGRMVRMITTGYGITLTPREEEVAKSILKQYETCNKRVVLVSARRSK